MKLRFKLLHENARLPEYATKGSSGMDVFAQIPGMGDTVGPGEIKAIPTGISVEVPKDYELQLRSRSGLAMEGLIVLNSPGTIDSDYRGEIKVLLMNVTGKAISLSRHARIAQLVLGKVIRVDWDAVEVLNETERGSGGFGSTGK